MAAELAMTLDELEAWMASRSERLAGIPHWKRKSYTCVRARPPKGWRFGLTASIEVQGLGRGQIEYERVDGTIDVRFHVRRVERFLAAQKQKGRAV